MPAVSIIVPAYQVTPYVTAALESVFTQTLSDFEVIVVNDCCPDTLNLERVLRPFQSRIRYIKLERNSGVAAARNAGIEASTSAYVAFLDADDIWDPRYLELNLGMIRADPSLDVVYGNARIFGTALESGRLAMDLRPSVGDVNFSSLISLRCNVWTSSATVRRAMILQVGMFDVRLRRSEDFDLWLRIAKAGGRFAYHSNVVMHYRRRDCSLTSDSLVTLRAIIDYYDNVKRNFTLTPAERQLTESGQQAFCAELELVLGKQALEFGQAQDARLHLARAQSYYKSHKLAAVLILLRFAPRLLRWATRLRHRRALTRATELARSN